MKWLAFFFFLAAAYEEQEKNRWKDNYDKIHVELHQLQEKCKP